MLSWPERVAQKIAGTFCAALSGRKVFLGIAYPGWRRVRLTLGYYALPLQGNSATTLNAIIISNVIQICADKNFSRVICWRKPYSLLPAQHTNCTNLGMYINIPKIIAELRKIANTCRKYPPGHCCPNIFLKKSCRVFFCTQKTVILGFVKMS